MSQPLPPQLLAALGRAERRLPEISAQAVERYAQSSPHYGEGFTTEHVYPVMARNCRIFGQFLLRGAAGANEDAQTQLDTLAAAAQDRAEDGLPVTDLVDSYLMIVDMICQAVLSEVSAADSAGVGALLEGMFAQARRAVYTVSDAHQQEFEAVGTETREAARDLVRELISGRPGAELAQRLGTRVAPAYVVLALHLGEHPAEPAADEVGRRIAGRRKARRVQQEIRRTLGGDVLAALERDEGMVLIPADPGPSTAWLTTIQAMMPRLEAVAGATVRGGVSAAAATADLPRAAALARNLLNLVRARNDPGALGVLDNLLVEYQLAQPTDARTSLLRVIEPLTPFPELVETLQLYFDNDFNRRRTARVLQVHPNTIDNRLAKIADLTGTDPRTSRALMLLGSALTLANLNLPGA